MMRERWSLSRSRSPPARYKREVITVQKRTLKEQLQYVLIWLFFIWVSCLISIAVDALLVKIITGFIGEVSYFIGAIIHVITMIIGAGLPLAAISYMIAFHLGDFSPLNSVIEGSVAAVLHLGVGILLGFPVWITGGVKWLAGAIEYGDRLYGSQYMKDIALRNYLLAFLIFTVVYLVIKYVFGYLGRYYRIKQRIELTGSPIPPSKRDAG